jgi:hypothetical protein
VKVILHSIKVLKKAYKTVDYKFKNELITLNARIKKLESNEVDLLQSIEERTQVAISTN